MMMLAVLAAAMATASPDVPCDRGPTIAYTLAPLIPAALSSRYPNDVDVQITAKVSATGTASVVRSDAPEPLAGAVQRWLAQATYVPGRTDCKAVAADLNETVTFEPAASGLLPSNTWRGIDFGNFSYTDGPGSCDSFTLHDNSALAPKKFGDDPDITATVYEVFAGTIAGTPVALVRLTCSGPLSSYDALAQIFALKDGRAQRIGMICCGSKFGGDSPSPDNWLYVNFRDGVLYTDTWDSDHKCNAARDWVAIAYTIRNGKLVKTGRELSHHRAGVASAC